MCICVWHICYFFGHLWTNAPNLRPTLHMTGTRSVWLHWSCTSNAKWRFCAHIRQTVFVIYASFNTMFRKLYFLLIAANFSLFANHVIHFLILTISCDPSKSSDAAVFFFTRLCLKIKGDDCYRNRPIWATTTGRRSWAPATAHLTTKWSPTAPRLDLQHVKDEYGFERSRECIQYALDLFLFSYSFLPVWFLSLIANHSVRIVVLTILCCWWCRPTGSAL